MGMTAKQRAVYTARLEGITWDEVASRCGCSRRTARDLYDRALKHLPAGDDIAVLEAMKHFGTEMVPDDLWIKDQRYSMKLRPKKAEEVDFLERVTEAFQEIPTAPPIESPQHTLVEMMVVYPLFDAHLGMRAHAAVSGEEMDLEKGAHRIKTAMSSVMNGAPDAYRAVIINGGDFTHQTDDKNQTRKSGHVLDVDGRNIITVLEAIEVIAACIEMALTKHTFVEYYSVPGNHDPQNWETILIGLRERYRDHNRVRINFRLAEFSVVEHGEVAVFIHHGDKRTPKDLAMFCAAEFPEVWGRTRYRIVMTGHLHHIKTDEFPGIYWMQMPALTVRDQHASGGYNSHSLMMAIGFDRISEATRNTVKL
jgi:predicted phosphodiesterase